MKNVVIKRIEKESISRALDLATEVFLAFEAPDYSEEGIKEFEKSIHDPEYIERLAVYGAYADEELVGMIATRSNGTHIALFFVKGQYQRQGIGKKLFQTALTGCPEETMTVNSSPYAVPVYHQLGFSDTDAEQLVNGIRFTPMKRQSPTNHRQQDILAGLTSKDDKYACTYCERIIAESREKDTWYGYFEVFVSLLDHPKSLVRNRAIAILAANAQWDGGNRFDSILPEYLSHITDEKPITARQCVKALAEAGQSKPQLIPEILRALQNADLSKYQDSMRPLIQKDIQETVGKLADFRPEK